MTLEEWTRRLKAMQADLEGNRRSYALQYAQALRERIRARVQERGLNKDAVRFASYTPAYARRRARKGYQTSYVDFTRTGNFFADFKAYVVAETARAVEVAIGPQGPHNKNKLRGNLRKRGLMTAPSEDELRDTYAEWASFLISKFLSP